jgi:ribosomal protein S18 acetylase RimI-like enzyme
MTKEEVNNMDIALRNMTEQEFSETISLVMNDLAEGSIQSGNMTKDVALAQYATLLPKGYHTPGTEFSIIFNSENDEIGVVLVMERQPGIALIMYIEIKEQFRRKGYARKVLALVEDNMVKKNYSMIGLNVFKNNKAARALYESCGYVVHNIENDAITMIKSLSK